MKQFFSLFHYFGFDRKYFFLLNYIWSHWMQPKLFNSSGEQIISTKVGSAFREKNAKYDCRLENQWTESVITFIHIKNHEVVKIHFVDFPINNLSLCTFCP